MTDIVTRLRSWVHAVDALPASDLMDEAAADIASLRSRPCPYVTGSVTRYCTLTPFTLTDAEREAIERAITVFGYNAANNPYSAAAAATLRGLLERTKGGER